MAMRSAKSAPNRLSFAPTWCNMAASLHRKRFQIAKILQRGAGDRLTQLPRPPESTREALLLKASDD
jgi:hypothetical protein